MAELQSKLSAAENEVAAAVTKQQQAEQQHVAAVAALESELEAARSEQARLQVEVDAKDADAMIAGERVAELQSAVAALESEQARLQDAVVDNVLSATATVSGLCDQVAEIVLRGDKPEGHQPAGHQPEGPLTPQDNQHGNVNTATLSPVHRCGCVFEDVSTLAAEAKALYAGTDLNGDGRLSKSEMKNVTQLACILFHALPLSAVLVPLSHLTHSPLFQVLE